MIEPSPLSEPRTLEELLERGIAYDKILTLETYQFRDEHVDGIIYIGQYDKVTDKVTLVGLGYEI